MASKLCASSAFQGLFVDLQKASAVGRHKHDNDFILYTYSTVRPEIVDDALVPVG